MDRSATTNSFSSRAQDALRSIERDKRLDPLADRLRRAGRTVSRGPLGAGLRGSWLGHPLHPALTDLPAGLWTAATVLDLVGGRRSRRAATELVGLGILAAIPTAASGMADQTDIIDPSRRRVVVVHAVGNSAATVAYVLSWKERVKGHHLRGVGWGLVGAGLASAAGYLGGHLAFGSQDPVSETRSIVEDTLLEDDTLLIVSEVFVVEGTDGADLTDRS